MARDYEFDAYKYGGAELPPPIKFGGEEYNTPLITGYGNRMAIMRPGQEAVNEWGSPVSQEYVKDIEDTFSLTDEETERKIASQRPPSRPSDSALSYFDEEKKFLSTVTKDLLDPKAVYEKAKSAYLGNWNPADKAVQDPKNKMKIKQDADNIGRQAAKLQDEQNRQEINYARQAFKIGFTQREEERKNARELAEKTPNEMELIAQDLRDKSGRMPTAAEVLKAKQDRDLEKAKANRAILGNPAGAQAFPVWPEEDKQMAYQTKMLTGKNPTFSSRDSESRAGFEKGYNAFINSKGFSASDIALMQADYRAGNMSLGNMTKQEAPMNAFVLNINKQITKLETLYSNNDRVGIRLLDLPLRELKVKAKGSGLEASRASYLLEISNEIGKLSSGASASVQQLSDSAKEDWKKVHDPNLSLKELMVVLNATRDQANMRMTTWREAKEDVRASLKGLGGNQTPPPSKPRLTPAEAIEELRRRGRI